MPEADPRVPTPAGVDLDAVPPAQRERVLGAIRLICDADRHDAEWVVEPLAGGASNMNYVVTRGGGAFVLRVPPESDPSRFGLTRAAGLALQSAAAAAAVAPEVVAYRTPEGVCLVPYLDGPALDSEAFRQGDRIEQAGAMLRRLHQAPPVDATWSAFGDIRRFAAIAADEGLRLPADCDALLEANRRVEAVLDAVPGALALCHNDLLPQNFIDVGGRLWLIDWEFAGMGNRYFDLGNFATNIDLEEPEVERLLLAYGADEGELEVEVARVSLMRLVSGMREAYWAVVAEPVLDNDWDYAEWARLFFDRCRRVTGGSDFERWLAVAAARTTA